MAPVNVPCCLIR